MKNKSKIIVVVGLSVAFLTLITILILISIKNNNETTERIAEFENIRISLERDLPSIVENTLENYSMVESVESTSKFVWEELSPSVNKFSCVDTITINVYVDSSFDNLPEKEHLDYLKEINSLLSDEIETIKQESGYKDYANSINYREITDRYEVNFEWNTDISLIVNSSNNEYRKTNMFDSKYDINGKTISVGNSSGSISSSTTNQNKCLVTGCSNPATKTITGTLSGNTENYCQEHYNEMLNILGEMIFD